jgi:hypothetical protein
MPRIRFQNRWVEVSDEQLQALAGYGACALVKDFQQQQPKQSARKQPSRVSDPDDGERNPQEAAEIENRHAAVEKMRKARSYTK